MSVTNYVKGTCVSDAVFFKPGNQQRFYSYRIHNSHLDLSLFATKCVKGTCVSDSVFFKPEKQQRFFSSRIQRPPLELSLYLVTSRTCSNKVFVDKVLRAVEGGVTCVQIRDHNEDLQSSIATALELKKQLAPYKVPLLINNRIDVAIAVNAAGVHLGQKDFPYAEARKLLGPQAIIGLTVDSWEDVLAAEALDVDYLGVSQVFPSKVTKPGCQHLWKPDGLRKIRQFSKHRLVAIGGITSSNLPRVIQELNPASDGIAMVGKLWRAKDPCLAARKIKEIFQKSLSQQGGGRV